MDTVRLIPYDYFDLQHNISARNIIQFLLANRLSHIIDNQHQSLYYLTIF